MLARYATRFPVVEINSSFYRPHQQKTYRRWAEAVPEAFRFSVKVPRTISHDHALCGCGHLLDRFLSEVEGLGTRLGGLLLQLPPRLSLDPRTASTFFRMLRNRTDAPLVLEPRHASWFAPGVEARLRRYRVSRVAADPALSAQARRPGEGATWPYWRWHGSPRMYYSAYSAEALRDLASAVTARSAAPLPAWVIFDNTAHGFATGNALSFQRMLDPAPTGNLRRA